MRSCSCHSHDLLLVLLLLLCCSPHAIAYKLLIVFRRPSRNTVGFYKKDADTLNKYTLPRLEFLSLIDEGGNDIRLRPLIPSSPTLLFYLDENFHRKKEDEFEDKETIIFLQNIVRRCILTYGLFQVLCSGPCVDETAKLAQSSVRPPIFDPFNTLWRVGVVEIDEDYSSPMSSCLNLQEQRQIIQPFIPFFLDVVGLDPNKQRKQEIGPSSPTVLDFFILLVKCKDTSPLGEEEQQVLFCRRIAHGPAVGKGYSYASTPRRPRSGILKVLAGQRRKAIFTTTPTAMEPEIGWVMNNLARVERGKRVLDPFVGGGSLLLLSRILGAEELVGADAADDLMGDNSEVRREILETFAALNYGAGENWGLNTLSSSTSTCTVVPRLELIDIRTWSQHPHLFQRNHYDAIVTDPPYNIKEIVRGTGGEGEDYVKKREMVKGAVDTLLEMAAHVLVLNKAGGGRLVFFLPVWKNKPSESENRMTEEENIPETLSNLPIGLSLVYAVPQAFSPTFVRWLVCVEKCHVHKKSKILDPTSEK
jgi:hypothetical protein